MLSRGFTFIEILVVALVLAVVAVAVTSLGLLITRSAVESERKNVAQSIAGEEMEIARTYSYAHVEYTDADPPGEIERTKTIERNGQKYRVDSLITYVDDPLTKETEDFKQLTVKVSWPRATDGVVLSSFFVKGQRQQSGGICIPGTITCPNPKGLPEPFLPCPESGKCADIPADDGDDNGGQSPTAPPDSGGGDGGSGAKPCRRDSDCSAGNFCQEGTCQPNWCKIISGAPLVDSGACQGQLVIEDCTATCPSWRRLGELGVVSVCGRPSYCVITSYSFERCADNPACSR
ncbi:MAG: prepilin-type N-terminal cleavage/methylation domain-containing protein [Patescibacteria group bacterium]